MNYYVIGDQGQKYGPADVVVLNQWAQQNRLTPTTVLEDAQTGVRYTANQVPGLLLVPQNNFQSATQGGYQNPPNYQQYPRAGMGMGYGDDGSGDVKNAWIFGVLGLLCCPIIFSSLGIYHASNAQRKGNPSAQAAMYFCIATLVIGILLGVVTQSAFR